MFDLCERFGYIFTLFITEVLVEGALANGGRDNITVIVLDLVDELNSSVSDAEEETEGDTAQLLAAKSDDAVDEQNAEA